MFQIETWELEGRGGEGFGRGLLSIGQKVSTGSDVSDSLADFGRGFSRNGNRDGREM
jgi:hypothetical protein